MGLKPEVLDPQGKTVRMALKSLGFKSVTDVRVGKHFWIRLDGSITRERASREVSRMSAKVLTNAIIETFTFTIARGRD